MDIREKILSTDDRNFEVVECPEWGVSVRVYSMSTRDKTRFLKALSATGELPDDYFAQLVYLCACGEDGIRLFTEKDIELLQEKSAIATKRVTDVAIAINGLAGDAAGQAEKNSDAIRPGLPDTD